MGWRYFIITVGGLTLVMFLIRFVLFTIFESPKYLMGKGRDEEAVRIVHEVARRNGKTTNLTIDDLKACEPEGYVARTDASEAVRRYLQKLDLSHIRVLFSSRRLGLSTGLIMIVWALIGLGYPCTTLSCRTYRPREAQTLATAAPILRTGTVSSLPLSASLALCWVVGLSNCLASGGRALCRSAPS